MADRALDLGTVEASLKRLQTDWINFYRVTSPTPYSARRNARRPLNELVHAGKVRHMGCSNFSAAQGGRSREDFADFRIRWPKMILSRELPIFA